MAGLSFSIKTPYPPAGGCSKGRCPASKPQSSGNLFSGGGYGNAGAARVTASDTLNFSGNGYNKSAGPPITALQTLSKQNATGYSNTDSTPRSNFDRLKVASSFTPTNSTSFLLPTLRKTIDR